MTNPHPARFIRGFMTILRVYLASGAVCALLLVPVVLLAGRPLRVVSAVDPLASPPYAVPAGGPSLPVWCVVSETARAAGARAGTFEALDPGQWWYNVVAGEHGSSQLIDVTALSFPLPPAVRALVVSAAAVPALLEQSAALEAFSRAGGLLLIERPAGGLLELTGARDGEEAPISLTEILLPVGRAASGRAGAQASAPDRANMPERVPVSLELAPVRLEPGVRPLLVGEATAEGAVPVAWGRPLGNGAVVGVGFDLARTLVRGVQGSPRADFGVDTPDRSGALAGIPVPSDLMAGLVAPQVPVYDVLVQALWRTATRLVPLPGWWAYPSGAAGAYLCTHDEEGFGDRSRFMADEETRLGAVSTWFVLPEPISAEGVKSLESGGSEVALHWHRGFGGGNAHDRGFGPLVIERRLLDLKTQQGMVAGLLGRRPPPITRIHGLQWDPDFDSTFRRMVAAGIRMDSSYGPIGDQSAYRFGSLRPFRPLDRSGALLPMLEQPFVLQDDEAPPGPVLAGLIADGARFHLPIVPIFHVNTMAYKPSAGPIEAWLEGFQLAREAGLWSGTMGQYLDFLERRSRASIRIEAAGSGGWEGTVSVEGADQWLRLPILGGDGELEQVTLDGVPVVDWRRMEWPGGPDVLVAVPAGRHAVTASYGAVGGRGWN